MSVLAKPTPLPVSLKDINPTDLYNDDLNYSFLSRTFSSLSKNQKDKILQILNNTAKFEKVG